MNEEITVKPRHEEDVELSAKIKNLLEEKGLADKTALAVIHSGKWAGMNAQRFFYPASLYKLYVAGTLLEEAVKDKFLLKKTILIEEVNASDKEKEVEGDPRPLLEAGEKASISYLLKLMITRSDNTAANVLIDFLGREKINQFIKEQGWQGSEVTRKFLPREKESEDYKEAEQTKTCAVHLCEFFLAIEDGKIGSEKLSHMLKIMLGNQLDITKFRGGLPVSINVFHKTGWFDAKKETPTGVCGDAGIVEEEDLTYVYACMIKLIPEEGSAKLRELALPLHDLLKKHLV